MFHFVHYAVLPGPEGTKLYALNPDFYFVLDASLISAGKVGWNLVDIWMFSGCEVHNVDSTSGI